MKLNLRKLCLFCGVIDVFYITRFIWLNIGQGYISLIDDVISCINIYPEFGGGLWVAFVFVMSIIPSFPIVFSALLLIISWSKVRYVISAQIPVRLLLVVSSIYFLHRLLKQSNISDLFVIAIALFFSETLRLPSLYFSRNTIIEADYYGK